MLIGPAETPHPVLDVARLAATVLPAPTIVDRDDRLQAARKRGVSALLRLAVSLAAGVGENKDVERGRASHRLQLERDRLDRARDARWGLVIDGEEKRRARLQRAFGRRQRDRVRVLADEQRQEPEDARKRAERYPAEGDRRQHQKQELDGRELRQPEHVVELVGEGARQDGGAGKQRSPRDPIAFALALSPLCALAEILLGHIERGLGRKRGILHIRQSSDTKARMGVAHDFVHR